ncbi:hypothetical protein FQN49_008863, partial [Arthroderma sp. PD_2]
MDAGQKSQLSAGKRPDIIGDVSVAARNLTPEQQAHIQAGMYKSKWATAEAEYQTHCEKLLAGKGGPSCSQQTKAAVPAATSGPQRQAPTPTDNKATAGKQESKGKGKATTQTSTPPQRLEVADGGHKPSSQKGPAGKPLSNPPKPVNKAVGGGPSDSRHPPPVMSQQAKQTSPPPASANDDNSNTEAAKKRRRRGGRGRGKHDNEAEPAIAPTPGQSTFQPNPAKGNGPKQESAAGGSKNNNNNNGKPTATAPPSKTPAPTGAARKAADSKLAQPA